MNVAVPMPGCGSGVAPLAVEREEHEAEHVGRRQESGQQADGPHAKRATQFAVMIGLDEDALVAGGEPLPRIGPVLLLAVLVGLSVNLGALFPTIGIGIPFGPSSTVCSDCFTFTFFFKQKTQQVVLDFVCTSLKTLISGQTLQTMLSFFSQPIAAQMSKIRRVMNSEVKRLMMSPTVMLMAKPLRLSSHKMPSDFADIKASTDLFVIFPLAIFALQTRRPAITQQSPGNHRTDSHSLSKRGKLSPQPEPLCCLRLPLQRGHPATPRDFGAGLSTRSVPHALRACS